MGICFNSIPAIDKNRSRAQGNSRCAANELRKNCVTDPVTPPRPAGSPCPCSRLISWKVRRCSTVPRALSILAPPLQHDTKYSGGEGHGSRPAEHSLLKIMLEGDGAIFLSLPEIVQLAFGRDKKVWSTFQSAFGACKEFGVHVKRFAEETSG